MSIKQNIENFSTQNCITAPQTSQEGPKIPIFEGGIHWIVPKTEHYWALSLFLVKYSVLNLFLVLVRMQFPKSVFIYISYQFNISWQLIFNAYKMSYFTCVSTFALRLSYLIDDIDVNKFTSQSLCWR